MPAANILEFVVAMAACGALLLVLGLPVRWTLFQGRPDRFGLETIVMGGAVFGVFAWWWSSFGVGGMRRGMPVLLVLDAIALVTAGVRARPWTRLNPRAVLAPLTLLAMTVALFAVHVPGFFTHDDVGPVSVGNNDQPFYAMNAGHLLRAGFEDPSSVTTWDLGTEGKKDVVGAFLLLAGVEAATGVPIWLLTEASLGFGLFLIMAALAQLMGRLGVGGRVAGVTVALLAVLSSTFFYSILNGYVGWALTLGPVVLLLALAVELTDVDDAADRRRVVLLTALAATWGYVVYPHVVFFFLPVAMGVVLARALGKGMSLRAMGAAASALLAAFVLPALVIPDRFVISVHRTFLLDGTAAGWPLGRVRLAQWLGVARFPDPPTGQEAAIFGGPGLLRRVAVVAGALVVLVLAAVAVMAVLRLVRPGPDRGDWLALAGLIVGPIVLYDLLFRRYGELYQAWKSATYLQPVVVAALATAGRRLFRQARVPVLVAAAVACLFAVLTVATARPGDNVIALGLTDDHRRLAGLVDRFDIQAVNIDVAPGPTSYWDAMWAMHFMGDATAYPQSQTYVPTAPPEADWTLRTTDMPQPPGTERHVFGRFVLDHRS